MEATTNQESHPKVIRNGQLVYHWVLVWDMMIVMQLNFTLCVLKARRGAHDFELIVSCTTRPSVETSSTTDQRNTAAAAAAAASTLFHTR